MTKEFLYPLAALLLLSACETNRQDKEAIKTQVKQDVQVVQGKAQQSVVRVANIARDNIKKTSMLLREWWLTPLPGTQPRPVPPSYCYQVMQDIVCYRDALPGMTHKLVGYQGDGAAPPPVAQMRALPTSSTSEAMAAALPGARISNAKPVFIKPPAPVKEDKNTSGEVIAGSEPLPNPTLSPQL